MKTSRSPAASLQRLIVALSIGMATAAAQGEPVFSAHFDVAYLAARVGWSSDLGPAVIDESRDVVGSSTPITKSVVATRTGRAIGSSITQTGPYVLADEYWAASLHGHIDVPGPGAYGLFADVMMAGLWYFAIPGQTPAENAVMTMYFASIWEVASPGDIHPGLDQFKAQSWPLSGSETGSFRNSIVWPGYSNRVEVQASTYSGDTNLPGHLDFSYRIAFSTTPIDTSVFLSPAAPAAAPEPATWALALIGAVGLAARRRRGGESAQA